MEALDSQVRVLQREEREAPNKLTALSPQAPPGAVHPTRWTMLLCNLSAPNVQVSFGGLVCHHPDPSMF